MKKIFQEYMLVNKDYVLYESSNISRSKLYIHKDLPVDTRYRKVYDSDKKNAVDFSITGEGENSSENIKKKFAINNWSDSFINDKGFLNGIVYFAGHASAVIDFIDSMPLIKINKIKMLLNVPISVLDYSNLNLERLSDFMAGEDEDVKDKFYLSLFKSRKNQLRGSFGDKVELFLLEMYGKDRNKLSAYESFFPNIQNMFTDINLDIFEHIEPIFTVRLDVRKASKILNGVSEDSLSDWIQNFGREYAKSRSVLSVYDILDKSTNFVEVRVFQKEKVDSDCSRDDYIGNLTDFLKENKGIFNKTKPDSMLIEKWLLKRKISESLPVESIVGVKKNKI